MADLAESNPTLPPDTSIADRKAEHDVDETLRRGAERARKIREAKGRSGPKPLAESISERFLETYGQVATAIALPSPERILRIAPEEGDPPTIPESFRQGMVPQRFATVTFDTYEPVTRSQESALAGAKFWTERALAHEGCMLALIGPQGTGKSHLLYAAANALLGAGVRLYARPWYRLADELRYGGEHPITKREMEASEVRRSLWTQKIVLLDEVRPTAATAFDDTELTKFACHAYDSRYPMFITSNVNPLADVMGKPAASRYTQIVIEGPDRRQA